MTAAGRDGAEPPLVSVIIPNYNYERTLGHCIRAAQQQDYPRLEVIVVDDCSTDGSLRIAEESGAHVVRTPVNSRVATARNLGAATARGDILFFVDSDLALEPGAVANAVRILRADPGLGAICGTYLPEPLFPGRLIKEYRALQIRRWWAEKEAEGSISGLNTAMCAMWASVYREVGPFNQRLTWNEEQDYYVRLRARYDVHATLDIRGRHDHDDTLRELLRKVFNRALHSGLRWRQRGLPGGSTARAVSSAALVLAVLAGPLPLLLGPVGWLVPGLLAAAAVGLDAGTYAAAFAVRGPAFGLYFASVHLLIYLTSGVGTALGVLQGLLFRRRLVPAYDPAAAAPAGVGEAGR
jgi:GT2 family glycosyltransferase